MKTLLYKSIITDNTNDNIFNSIENILLKYQDSCKEGIIIYTFNKKQLHSSILLSGNAVKIAKEKSKILKPLNDILLYANNIIPIGEIRIYSYTNNNHCELSVHGGNLDFYFNRVSDKDLPTIETINNTENGD